MNRPRLAHVWFAAFVAGCPLVGTPCEARLGRTEGLNVFFTISLENRPGLATYGSRLRGKTPNIDASTRASSRIVLSLDVYPTLAEVSGINSVSGRAAK